MAQTAVATPWSVAGALRGPNDVEQVPGSFWGEICDMGQVQDRSTAGFATWNKSRIFPGQDLRAILIAKTRNETLDPEISLK